MFQFHFTLMVILFASGPVFAVPYLQSDNNSQLRSHSVDGIKNSTPSPFFPATNSEHENLLQGRSHFAQIEPRNAPLSINGSCKSLSAADAQKLSGWSKIQAAAVAEFGSSNANIITNPEQYPTQNAVFCAPNDAIPVQINGNYTCQDTGFNATSTLYAASGYMRLIFQQGISITSSWSTTTASSLAIGSAFQVTFGIPGVASVKEETKVTGTTTNEARNTFTTQGNNLVSTELWVNEPYNSTCQGYLQTQSCTATGQVEVKFVAYGTIWFNFDSPVKDKNTGLSHYKYGLLLEAFLPENERMGTVEVSGNIAAGYNGQYYATCQ